MRTFELDPVWNAKSNEMISKKSWFFYITRLLLYRWVSNWIFNFKLASVRIGSCVEYEIEWIDQQKKLITLFFKAPRTRRFPFLFFGRVRVPPRHTNRLLLPPAKGAGIGTSNRNIRRGLTWQIRGRIRVRVRKKFNIISYVFQKSFQPL